MLAFPARSKEEQRTRRPLFPDIGPPRNRLDVYRRRNMCSEPGIESMPRQAVCYQKKYDKIGPLRSTSDKPHSQSQGAKQNYAILFFCREI